MQLRAQRSCAPAAHVATIIVSTSNWGNPNAGVVSRVTSQVAPAGSCTAQRRPVSNATQEASCATGSDSTDIMAGIHAAFTVHSLRPAASSVQWPHPGALQQGAARLLHNCLRLRHGCTIVPANMLPSHSSNCHVRCLSQSHCACRVQCFACCLLLCAATVAP